MMRFTVLVLSFGLLPCLLRGDEVIKQKMLGLLPQFDTNRDGTLDPREQMEAVKGVQKAYGEQWSLRILKMLRQASGPNKAVDAQRWQKEVAAFDAAAKAQTFRVAMRDGVHLATDVFIPPGEGPFPVLLSRTPYGRVKRGQEAASFVREGIVFVIQDMRGRFDSEGENTPFVGCGWSQHQDGVDTIEWLRKQPWCNGKVGTIGGSAGGITQNLLAGAAPDGLTAQYISVAATSLYEDATYTGGALRKADTENWVQGNKFDPKAMQTMRERVTKDSYWDTFDTATRFSMMNVPAVHAGGWFDIFAQGTLDQFTGRQNKGAAGSRGTQKLVMGPWTHPLGKMPVGELTFPNSVRPAHLDPVRWFSHYLLGVDNGVDQEPAVTYFVMGDVDAKTGPGNEWRKADAWPIPATETAFYFSKDRALSTTLPTEEMSGELQYVFDPNNPCPTLGGANLTIPAGPRDIQKLEARDDVLTFTTEPLDAPLEVTGRVKAKVFIASSAVDTDLSVRLCDVYPDGRSYPMAEGMLRLRCRKSLQSPEVLQPGKVEQVEVDCWSTSIVFNSGHRIRATITSSNYPRFDINPGTGKPWIEGCETVKQSNRILCTSGQASCLLLPVVKGK